MQTEARTVGVVGIGPPGSHQPPGLFGGSVGAGAGLRGGGVGLRQLADDVGRESESFGGGPKGPQDSAGVMFIASSFKSELMTLAPMRVDMGVSRIFRELTGNPPFWGVPFKQTPPNMNWCHRRPGFSRHEP